MTSLLSLSIDRPPRIVHSAQVHASRLFRQQKGGYRGGESQPQNMMGPFIYIHWVLAYMKDISVVVAPRLWITLVEAMSSLNMSAPIVVMV
jgi:hypothetical protein